MIAIECGRQHTFIAGDAAIFLVACGGIGIGVRLAVGIVVAMSEEFALERVAATS